MPLISGHHQAYDSVFH